MSDILSQLITLPVRIGLGVTVVILIILYLLAIVWVNRDAHERDTSPVVWTVIAIIPVAGLVAYCLMRPPLTRRDASEQDMELKLLRNQLKEYGSCPHCGYPGPRRQRPVCSQRGRHRRIDFAQFFERLNRMRGPVRIMHGGSRRFIDRHPSFFVAYQHLHASSCMCSHKKQKG